jgi:hypothetical protein
MATECVMVETVSLSRVSAALDSVKSSNNDIGLAAAAVKVYTTTPYGYLFPALPRDEALLRWATKWFQGLIELGKNL